MGRNVALLLGGVSMGLVGAGTALVLGGRKLRRMFSL